MAPPKDENANPPANNVEKRRSRVSYTSFDNLVALANAQEAWNKSLEHGRKLVWRDTGAPPVILETLEECAKHAAVGGLRAAALAWGIRSGINLFLLLASVVRMHRKFRYALVQHAIFGRDSRHFAAMLGTFTVLYKVILNALPILIRRYKESHKVITTDTTSEHCSEGDIEEGPLTMPEKRRIPSKSCREPSANSTNPTESASSAGPTSPRPPHLSSATKASLSLAQEHGITFEPWHATLAGSIAAGVAILLERRNNRSAVGQQMFVRGLQGVYNTWSRKTGVVVPYGSVAVFSLCCAQILYAYLLKPHSLPPAYDAWIQSMSNAPLESLKINRSLVLTGSYDPALLETIVSGRSKPWTNSGSIITPESRKALVKQLELAQKGVFGPRLASCEIFHPHRTHCVPNVFMKTVEVAKLLLPVYGALYAIPTILFKGKSLLKNPMRYSARIILGALRSSTFLGVFVSILQAGVCFLRNLHFVDLGWPWNQVVRSLAKSQVAWWLWCSLSGLSLLLEAEHRREELAMYVLPKAGESAWITLREEVLGIKHRRKGAWKADVALSAAGMGMVMTIYQTNPAALSGLVRRILYQFIGPN